MHVNLDPNRQQTQADLVALSLIAEGFRRLCAQQTAVQPSVEPAVDTPIAESSASEAP